MTYAWCRDRFIPAVQAVGKELTTCWNRRSCSRAVACSLQVVPAKMFLDQREKNSIKVRSAKFQESLSTGTGETVTAASRYEVSETGSEPNEDAYSFEESDADPVGSFQELLTP